MSTLAGPTPFQPTPDVPHNRGVVWLEYAAGEPRTAAGALDADMAAGDIALAIVRGRDLLSVRERMVLAAALLPEFDGPTP